MPDHLLKTLASPVIALVVAAAPLHDAYAQGPDLGQLYKDGTAAYESKNYASAASSFDQIYKAQGANTVEGVMYLLGFSYYLQQKYEEAAPIFEQFVQKFPQSKSLTEVQFCLGRSYLNLPDKTDLALKFLGLASRAPEYADDARFLAAEAYIKKGDKEKAAKILKDALAANSTGPGAMRALLSLVDLYIQGDELEDATSLLRSAERSSGYADVIVAINHRFVQIGDKLLEAKSYAGALDAYSAVRPRNQVLSLQKSRLEVMKRRDEFFTKRIAEAEAAKQQLPINFRDSAAMLKAMISNLQQVLGQVEAAKEYDATLQFRIGRCYFNMNRFWQSSVAFEAVADDHPDLPDAQNALFGAIISQYQLKRFDAARSLAVSYLEKFPQGTKASVVAELNATIMLEQNLTKDAVAFLTAYLEANPSVENKETLLTLLANSHFQGGNYDAAAVGYDLLRQTFASSQSAEDYVYRRALCDFLRNKYEDTIKSFDEYEKTYPDGKYLVDVRYRRGIILLAKKDYKELVTSMESLLRDPRSEGFRSQIHVLLGDALSAPDNTQNGDMIRAADEYASAVRKARQSNTPDDQNMLTYSLEQATTMYRGARRSDELAALWNDFLKANPGHPMELRGISELSKLLQKAKKIDDAKALLLGNIKREIHNVRSEYVEMLLSQYASLFVPPRAKAGDPPPAVDPEEALAKALELPEAEKTPAYIARVNFAKSELARMMRDMTKAKRSMSAIANSAQPSDLGPVLLSMVGEYLRENKEPDKAVPFYIRLRDGFPQSAYADAAPVGLGYIELEKKNYNAAIENFDFALNGAGSQLKEATYGKAQALMALSKNDEAKKLFEEIIKTREWKGMEKADANFQLGEIYNKEGDKAKAHYYYQQVYLAHGQFPELVAKAYLRAADMLDGLGKSQESKDTLLEMLRKDKLKDTPEYQKAKQRLGK